MNKVSIGLIYWFARNPVAANLVMCFIFFAGAISSINISKEMFPRTEIRWVNVSVDYPGAAPVEVEKGVVLPIEAALEGLQGIKTIRSNAFRDRANIALEIDTNEDINEIMSLIENRVDGITNFPNDIERPEVMRARNEIWALGVSVFGDMTQRERKKLGEEIHDELMALPEVKESILWGAGEYEISIEVSETRLRELDLTFSEIASAVRNSSLDLPAGMIKSGSGHLLLRTEGKSYDGSDFSNIVLRSSMDGSQLLLSDVAKVKDGFEESIYTNRFDQRPAFTVGIFSLEGQNVLDISEAVHAYVESKQAQLGNETSISAWSDEAYYLNGRLAMMSENLFLGLIFVALVLTLFLNTRVALWVIVGIPISFAGAFWLMPVFDVTVNVLSLFAFIMVLGIVVDDAIVIGESIYREVDADYEKKLAAGSLGTGTYRASVATVVAGTQRVAIPSTIGVLTTMAAFLPVVFAGGTFDGITRAIGIVVILCLAFSLIESKLILPAHLVGLTQRTTSERSGSLIGRCQTAVSRYLESFITNTYLPALKVALTNRYISIAGFVSILILAIAAVSSGLARYEFFPDVPGDIVQANVTMQDGSSPENLTETMQIIENAIYEIQDEYRRESPNASNFIEHLAFWVDSDVSFTFFLELTKSEFRDISAYQIEKLWREKAGLLPNVRKQRYSASDGSIGPKISLSLSGSNPQELTLAGYELQKYLAQFPGVYDIYNSQGSGSKEVLIKLKPYAEQIDVRLSDIATQVRQAFYGEEAQRIQRDSETVKVMVRYPYEARRSLSTLENMQIRTPSGSPVAIGEVASIDLGTGLTAIERLDRKRTVTISAEVEAGKVESDDVIADVSDSFVPGLLERFPSVEYRLTGSTQEKNAYYTTMTLGLAAALFMIYGLLAVPLKSYVQPVVIMSVIPFGFIGAVIGHVLFDTTINMLSVFGIIALAGVVVNDSLILVEFSNRERNRGLSIENALLSACKQRFRAILLTTLTTFVGLLPLLFETSAQAQFVIPMALSLSFGILFASTITLVLIPCLYLSVENNHRFVTIFFMLPLLAGAGYIMVILEALSFWLFQGLLAILALICAILFAAKMFGFLPERKRSMGSSS